MTPMLKTCLSPTDGTRTKTLPSGYEMSRRAISYEGFVSQNRGVSKRRLGYVDGVRRESIIALGWLNLKRGLTLIWSTEVSSESAREVKRPSMAKTSGEGGHSFIVGSDWERSLGDWNLGEAGGGTCPLAMASADPQRLCIKESFLALPRS